MSKRQPAKILQYFAYAGLPRGSAREIAETFYALADEIDGDLPECAEKSAGLRKLLEARDCVLRAAQTEGD